MWLTGDVGGRFCDGELGGRGSRTAAVAAGRYPGAEGDGVRGGTYGAISRSG